MRISGGYFKGRQLTAPKSVRATEDKVRQAFFNIIGPSIRGVRFLDGFAGSGAIGIEALSRGADFVVFIDSDAESALAIRDNIQQLSDEVSRESWQLMNDDMERSLAYLAKKQSRFDIVYFDPPYASDEAKKALIAIGGCAILDHAGLVVIEHDQRTAMPASSGSLRQIKQHRYGDTVLSLYQAGDGP